MSQHPIRTMTDLPAQLPVFPLPGALLFPRWQLPLNIFEPRYLNMIDDVMQEERVIGMIQSMGGPKSKPNLAHTGCAGRITAWSETGDGRYLITLTGLARFNIKQELSVTTPYRQVLADWAPYEDDLYEVAPACMPDRHRLVRALRDYTDANDMSTDWQAVEEAPLETLVNALCSGCPFSVIEKQALIEAQTLKDRAETLITLLEMDVSGPEGGTLQ
ncbi:MAG: peptidase S16 [Alphaproteobacteria bacterium]|nr:peptidase S16 [Alphaproteobacteria bacterium]|tara:strand:- start:2817 stop:3467 length:651 start_codon:yes stop_codon:yes gene_type:complete